MELPTSRRESNCEEEEEEDEHPGEINSTDEYHEDDLPGTAGNISSKAHNGLYFLIPPPAQI